MAEENNTTVTEPVTTQPAEPTTQTEPQAAEKKYDDKQVNDLIAKAKGKEAERTRADMLKELGITDLEAFKAAQKKQADEAEAKKTADQKLQEMIEEQKKQLETLRSDNEKSKMVAAALKAGISENAADKIAAAAMGYEGETPADKVKAYIADFPWIIKPAESGETTANGKPFGGKTTTKIPDASQSLIDQIEAMTGIKKAPKA